MMQAHYPPLLKPDLVQDRWTAPFWDAARAKTLTVPVCAACGTYRFPPTPFCPNCQSSDIRWQPLSGRGQVYAFTVVRRAIIPEVAEHIPYVPALITLSGAGGLRLMSAVVDTPVEAVQVGMEVEVVWSMHPSDQPVPYFRPTQPRDSEQEER